MKNSNNKFFIFLNDKEDSSKASDILREKYSVEMNNLIEAVHQLSDAEKLLKKYYQSGVLFDIILLDLKLPINTRKQFIGVVNQHQAEYECVLVTNGCQLEKEDKSFIDETKAFLIPFISKRSLYPLLENIIEKKFKKKELELLKEIGIAFMKLKSGQLLTDIVNITLKHLGLKICSVTLVDYRERKLKIGALTGMGEYEEEFRENFDISLSEKSVITECINKKIPIQYEDILHEHCPFKYKELAKKMGLKSILVTPIYETRGSGTKRVLATLDVYTKFYHKFQDDELELTSKIADKTIDALLQKEMLDKEKIERERDLALIEKVPAEINKNVSDYKKVFKTIVAEGIRLVRADQGCIKLCFKDKTTLESFAKCRNDPCEPERCGDIGITNYVMKHKESLIINDINDSPYKDSNVKYTGPCSRISVPLMFENAVIGILTAEQNEKDYFTEHHRRLFEALAKHAVIAIENTKRYKQLEKRLQSQLIIKTLIEETSRLEAIEDKEERKKYLKDQLDKIIKYTIEKTGKIFDAQSGFVALAELTSKYAVRRKKWQFGLKEGMTPPLEIGVVKNGKVVFEGQRCIVGKVIADGKLYNCKNTENDDYYQRYGGDDITKSEIVIPLKFQEQTFGAFSLDSIRESTFSKEDEEILISIATQIALLITRFRFLNKLVDLNKPFKKIDNLARLYDEIRDMTLDMLDTNVCYLRVVEKNEFVIKSYKGISDPRVVQSLKPGEGISGRVAKTLKPQVIRDVQEEFEFRYQGYAKENNLFAMMAVPVYSSRPDGTRELIGVLNTFANRICDFTSLDLQLMLAVAEKAGEAIKKARLFKQLDEIAKVDRVLTTTSEQVVLQNIAEAAKNLLDANQVVLYRYNSNIYKNFGFSTPATISGEFSAMDFELQENFNENSFMVHLLREKPNEFYIESFEYDKLIKKFRKNSRDSEVISRFYEREQLESAIILKLKFKKEIVGILFINYRYKMYFSPEIKRIAETFANKIAIAISNIRKIEEVRYTIKRMISNLTAVQKSGYDIVKNLNKDQVTERDILQPIMDKALELIDVDMGYIAIPIRREKSTKIVVCSDKYEKLLNSSFKYYYAVESEWIKRHEKYGIYPDENKKGDYIRFADEPEILSCFPDVVFTADKGVQSALRVPIYSDKDFLGMIVLESEKEKAFTTNDAYAVMALANQASLALQNYKLIKQLRKLSEIDIAILKGHGDIDYVLEIILQAALDLVNKNYGEISLLIDEDTLKIEKSIPEKVTTDILKVNDSIQGIPILSKMTHYEPNIDISKNKKFVKTKRMNTKSELVVPLLVDEDLIGVLNIESDEVDDFPEGDIKVLEMLSRQAAIAIYLAQQKERLIEKEREANLGYVTRESVHWVGNKIGPISRRVESITEGLEKLKRKGIINDEIFTRFLKDLSIIQKGTNSALSIKSDLIDVGKQKENFDLIKLLKDTIGHFKKEYNAIEIKKLSETYYIPYKISFNSKIKSFQFRWDMNHIGRIFHYILKNAFQAIEDKIFTMEDSQKDNFVGTISVRVYKNAKHLLVEVEDNGIGMKKEFESEIFRPFHTTKGADRGSGVGLYFCKRTMSELRGNIYIKETEYLKGTAFCLEFPLELV
jgi:GAF domain-containing protein